MSTESNKAMDRRLVEIQNTHTLAFDDIIAPDFVGHFTGFPEVRGLDAYKQIEQLAYTVFPDFHLTIEDQVAEGDKVVSRWTAHGTHQGSLTGETPTGNAVTFTGIRVVRIVNGRVVEEWDSPDQLGLMRQIGLIAAQG